MPTVTTPNMNLIVPVVGQESGPQYATDINSSLSIVDTHDHSSGKGVQVTPAGMNISSDLTFTGNQATNLKSAAFTPQSSPLDPSMLTRIYVSGSDLYYNDDSGNQIRITQNGSISTGGGSIVGLPSGTASVQYVPANSTYVFQSATDTPANIDGGSVIFRNIVANSFGLTLQPPASLSSNYTLTLPTIPVAQRIMSMDNTGQISANVSVDGTTIQLVGNVLSTITTSTTVQIVSSSSGTFQTSSTTPVDATNLSVTITTTGNPVFVNLQSDMSSNISALQIEGANIPIAAMNINIVRDSTTIAPYQIFNNFGGADIYTIPPGSILIYDNPIAGTYTYKIQVSVNNASINGRISYCTLVATTS